MPYRVHAVAFSTSSPLASVAAFDDAGALVWSADADADARHRAGEFCLSAIESNRIILPEVRLWLADLGPGSFTGTRVGVVLAKTLAWTYGAQVAGASSFDLISPNRTVALPNRKNEWLVRIPGEPPALRTKGSLEDDVVGYAPGLPEEKHPEAWRFRDLLPNLVPGDPMALVPEYVVPPSISVSKRPIPGVAR